MLERVHIQILDNPLEDVILDAEEFEEPVRNKVIAEQLRTEMNHSYPTMVSVEYIDLFMGSDMDFPEIRELLRRGAITAPVILINGIPKIHGGIPRAVIKDEVDRLLSKGPWH